jgi:putative hydrolase of the HAD superfamily
VIALSNTTFSNAAIKTKLRKHGLLKYLDFVIVSSNYLFRKPSPWLFEMGLRKLNLRENEVWMIGNDYACDIEGAKQCGMFTVWYNAQNDPDPHQAADINIQNYYQLLLLLNDIK